MLLFLSFTFRISDWRFLVVCWFRMFVSRTVAAEVCMEAKSNEAAYKALKQLDKSGRLLFELSCVILFAL